MRKAKASHVGSSRSSQIWEQVCPSWKGNKQPWDTHTGFLVTVRTVLGSDHPATLLQCLLHQEVLPDYHFSKRRESCLLSVNPNKWCQDINFTIMSKAHIYQSFTLCQELYLYCPI